MRDSGGSDQSELNTSRISGLEVLKGASVQHAGAMGPTRFDQYWALPGG